MRWFKHLTIANRDEALARIRDEFGLEGYGLYWLILESIAEQMDGSERTFLELSPKNWRRITGISPKKFQKFVTFAENLGIFSVEISENLIRVDCPKLLKFRDEYTKRKKKTPDKLPTNSGECQEQDTDTDTESESEEELNPKAYCAAQPPGPQDEASGDLFFPISDGEPCRLKSEQVDRWQENFRFVDVRGQIASLIAWYETPGEKGGAGKRWSKRQWFNALSGWLAKKSQAALIEAQARDPTFDPLDPDGNKKAAARKAQTMAMIRGLAAEKAAPTEAQGASE